MSRNESLARISAKVPNACFVRLSDRSLVWAVRQMLSLQESQKGRQALGGLRAEWMRATECGTRAPSGQARQKVLARAAEMQADMPGSVWTAELLREHRAGLAQRAGPAD